MNICLIFHWFVLLTVSCYGLGDSDWNEGDLCKVKELDDANGECGNYNACPYAIEQSGNNGQNITYCSKAGERTPRSLVCCPKDEHKTGPLGKIFAKTPNGKLAIGLIVCVYTGRFPLVCWSSKGTKEEPDFRIRTGAYPQCTNKIFSFPACNACFEFSKKKDALCTEELAPKIANGQEADIADFPHLALIGFRTSGHDDTLTIQGAGTLITSKWILTAAHVINFQSTVEKEEILAMMGTTYKANVKDSVLVKVHPYIYPEYKGHSQHDIGLVKLLQGITIQDKIKPACLPVKEILLPTFPKEGVIAGWGKLKDSHPDASKNLNQAILHLTLCDERNGTFRWRKSETICIRPSVEQIDACEGDSGGSLITAIHNKDICGYSVLGVVSRGAHCGDTNSFYVNVRNRDYLRWIIDTIWPQTN